MTKRSHAEGAGSLPAVTGGPFHGCARITYRVWLRYELFRGRLNESEFSESEKNLAELIKVRANTKPHLHGLVEE
jgi:hypothetical protein